VSATDRVMTDMLDRRQSMEDSNDGATLIDMQALDLTILYEDGDDGWIVASIPAVPGVFSQGRDRAEARENVLDALALMLSPEPVEAGDERERELLHLTVS
jgi:predicted RNase H-like HicB family nuclease